MNPLVRVARKARDLFYGVRPFSPAERLRANFRSLDAAGETRIIQSLKSNYFSYLPYFPDPVEEYLATEDGRTDLAAHVNGRLQSTRNHVVPWIENTTRLQGTKVLEIGCGTGSSTVALVEQGAEVLATDIHEGSLRVAKDRLDSYQLVAQLVCGSADEVFTKLRGQTFDMVAIFAVLEHMTLEERLQCLKDAWTALPPGGLLVIHETPNRLWFFDDHTARDYFYMWLPDDLAIRYAKRTPRKRYNKLFLDSAEHGKAAQIQFSRWGRGVSYHDFVLALDVNPSELPVESCLELFRREKTRTERPFRRTFRRRYEQMLHSMQPDIHRGFFFAIWI